ncbi:hypothetical protein Agub_g6914, partial [Astrephomene gubernaculifera]
SRLELPGPTGPNVAEVLRAFTRQRPMPGHRRAHSALCLLRILCCIHVATAQRPNPANPGFSSANAISSGNAADGSSVGEPSSNIPIGQLVRVTAQPPPYPVNLVGQLRNGCTAFLAGPCH